MQLSHRVYLLAKLGVTAEKQGRLEEAEGHLREAFALTKTGDPSIEPASVIAAVSEYAAFCGRHGKRGEMVEALEAQIARISLDPANDSWSIQLLMTVATSALDDSDRERAHSAFSRGLVFATRIATENNERLLYNFYANMADNAFHLEKYQEAEALLRSALDRVANVPVETVSVP